MIIANKTIGNEDMIFVSYKNDSTCVLNYKNYDPIQYNLETHTYYNIILWIAIICLMNLTMEHEKNTSMTPNQKNITKILLMITNTSTVILLFINIGFLLYYIYENGDCLN